MKVVTNQVVITLDGNDVIKAVEDHLNKIYPNLRVKSIEPAMGLRNALECSALCELKSGKGINLKPIEPMAHVIGPRDPSLFESNSKKETFATPVTQSTVTPKIPAKSFTRNNYGIGAFLGEYFKQLDKNKYPDGVTAYTVYAYAKPKFPELGLGGLIKYLDRADYQKRYSFTGKIGGGNWPKTDGRNKLIFYKSTLD